MSRVGAKCGYYSHLEWSVVDQPVYTPLCLNLLSPDLRGLCKSRWAHLSRNISHVCGPR